MKTAPVVVAPAAPILTVVSAAAPPVPADDQPTLPMDALGLLTASAVPVGARQSAQLVSATSSTSTGAPPTAGTTKVAAAAATTNATVLPGQLKSGATIPVGAGPTGIVVSGTRVYTANTAGNSITAIDGSTGAALATVPVGRAPTSLTVSAAGDVLYVANSGDNTVTAVNTTNGAILSTMAVGYSPQGIAISPAGRLYVSNTASNTVSVLNPTSGQTVATVAVGNAPVGVTVSPDGSRVYVANRGQNTVSVLNTATNAVIATYAVGAMPQAIAVNAAGTRLYVTNSGSDDVSVIDTGSGANVATIAVRDQPFGIALSKDGSLAYVANSDSSVSVIDTATNTKVVGTLRTETATGSMVAVSSDGSTLYTTYSGGATVRMASYVTVGTLPPANVHTAGPVYLDFNGAAGSPPDPAVWSYLLGAGGATGEQNAYTNSPANASLDGQGHLVIQAIQEPVVVPGYGTYPYSSAYLTTQRKLDFTYGTVSARIKFPSEQGVLPAFWMLGSDVQQVGWPTGGELDIMEVTPAMSGSSIHSPAGSYSVGTTQTLDDDFHTYWMTWEPNKITTGVDGTTLATFTPDSLPPGAPWTFNDRSMYAILNVAVGSPFGQPDATTQFPAEMVVDWFRYEPLTTSV